MAEFWAYEPEHDMYGTDPRTGDAEDRARRYVERAMYSRQSGKSHVLSEFDPRALVGKEVVVTVGGKSIADYFEEHVARREQELQNEEGWMSKDPELLRRQAQRLMEEAELIETMPEDDPFDNGTVMTFDKSYGGKVYNYAVIKSSDGLWYGTTTKPHENRGYAWNELIAWIGYKAASTLRVSMVSKPIMEYLDNMTTKAVAIEESKGEKA